MPTALSSTAPISQLNRQHRHYASNREVWTSYDLLYRGGPAMQNDAARFLRKRQKEMQDVYNERLARITYQNILGTVLGWYQSSLFRKDPEIDFRNAGTTDPYKGANQEFYTNFLQNCDRSGTTYIDQWRLVMLNLLLFRDCYVCVDLPHSDQNYGTLYNQKASGALDPYVMVYDPRNVINWQVDDYGNFDWIVIRIQQFRQEFLGDAVLVERWYYYDRTDYRVYEVEQRVKDDIAMASQIVGADGRPISSEKAVATLVAQGKHALSSENRVPVHYVTIPEGLHLASRAYLPAIAHLNLENSYYYALHMSNLPIPLFKADGDIQTNVISETSYMQIGQKDDFTFMEPSGQSYDHSQKCLNQIREEIYRQMYLMAQGRDSSASASSSSGYSKEMDMLPSREVLSAFGDIARAGMQGILNDVAIARGDRDIEFDVRGFIFQESNVIQLIEELELLMSLDIPSDELYKQKQKQVAQAALPDANRGVIDQVNGEIEDAPTRSEQQAQQAQQQQLQMDRTLNRNVDAMGKEAMQSAG